MSCGGGDGGSDICSNWMPGDGMVNYEEVGFGLGVEEVGVYEYDNLGG